MALSPIFNLNTFALSGPVDVSDASSAPGYHCDPLSKAAGPNNSVLKSVGRSRTSSIMCHLHIRVVLRRGTVRPLLVTWCIEQALADAERDQTALEMEEYNAPLWFWAVMLGARATKATGASSPDETSQLSEPRTAFTHKIRRASLALNLYVYSWAQAQPVLAMFALLDDSGDDLELAEMCGGGYG